MSKKKVIPPIDYLQRSAKRIQSDRDPSSIKNKLSEFMHHYDALTIEMNYENLLWRAQKANGPDGYDNIERIYYPPVEKTIPGRLNEANDPLLYVSFNKFIVLTEKQAEKDDHVHIIGYSMKDNQSIRILILGEFFYSHKGGQGNLPGNFNEWMNERLENMKHESRLSFIFMDAFLSSLLTDETASDNEYLYTRLLAKILFEKYSKIDAIYYPSVVSNGAMNLAIKPKIADKVLEAKETSVLLIDNIFEHGLFRFREVKNSKEFDQNGKILWE